MTGVLFRKELRALAVPVGGGVVAMAAAWWLHDAGFPRFVAMAYIVASFSAGALSIGHEFSDRTLLMLLSQPAPRWKVLGTKLAALAVSLALLAGTAALAGLSAVSPAFLLLPLAGAFLAAPWLTMACRSALAGAVFTFAIPATLFLGTQYAASLAYGALTDEAERLSRLTWYSLMAVAVAFTGIGTWRRFAALEATEGASEAPFQFPAWGWRSRGPGHPIAMMARKELHLHHISILGAGAYAVIWLSAVFGLLPGVSDRAETVVPLTMIFAIVGPLVVGATTSAEERQFGTREWHLTLPVPAWQQWVVKAGVALVLAVALGVALPMLLGAATLDGHIAAQMRGFWRIGLLVTVPLAAVGIYVSSLSSSGVRAIAVAFPAALVLALFFSRVEAGLARTILPPTHASLVPPGVMAAALAYGLAALGLRFAYVNHGDDRPNTSRVLLQVAIVLSAAVAGLVAIAI